MELKKLIKLKVKLKTSLYQQSCITQEPPPANKSAKTYKKKSFATVSHRKCLNCLFCFIKNNQ